MTDEVRIVLSRHGQLHRCPPRSDERWVTQSGIRSDVAANERLRRFRAKGVEQRPIHEVDRIVRDVTVANLCRECLAIGAHLVMVGTCQLAGINRQAVECRDIGRPFKAGRRRVRNAEGTTSRDAGNVAALPPTRVTAVATHERGTHRFESQDVAPGERVENRPAAVRRRRRAKAKPSGCQGASARRRHPTASADTPSARKSARSHER